MRVWKGKPAAVLAAAAVTVLGLALPGCGESGSRSGGSGAPAVTREAPAEQTPAPTWTERDREELRRLDALLEKQPK